MVPATVLILPNYQTLVALGWLDSYQGMMAPYIASAFGTFLMRQAFKQVPKELEEAARSDGANWLQVLWHVLPAGHARPAAGIQHRLGDLSLERVSCGPC